jgi:Family of unknown function (DUF6401)
MMGIFGGLAARVATRSALSSLHGLMAAIGYTGLSTARRMPALLASVDQHAAAIRNSLDGDDRPISAVALAAYAEGVRDAAFRHGWRSPAVIDWSADDWVLHRLLAVCLLSHALHTA